MTNDNSIAGKLNSRTARVLLAAGAIAAAAIAATPAANAAGFRGAAPAVTASFTQITGDYYVDMLSEYEIRHLLRSCGYHRVESISYVPGAYIAQAWRHGRLVNLRIDPYEGRILGRSYVQVRQYRRPHHYGYRGFRGNHRRGMGYGIYFGF